LDLVLLFLELLEEGELVVAATRLVWSVVSMASSSSSSSGGGGGISRVMAEPNAAAGGGDSISISSDDMGCRGTVLAVVLAAPVALL